MKKSIIAAGAASIALAAMPVVSTFALTKTVEDDITVQLNSTCTITREGANGTGGTGVVAGQWTAPTGQSTTGTYSVTMDAGSMADLGTSTFTIVCNDTAKGNSLSVATTGLNGQGAALSGKSIGYSNDALASNAPGWNITVAPVAETGMPAWNTTGVVGGIVQSASGTAALYDKTTTVLNGASFTANYKVSTVATTEAGTYTGSAIYTLTHGE